MFLGCLIQMQNNQLFGNRETVLWDIIYEFYRNKHGINYFYCNAYNSVNC